MSDENTYRERAEALLKLAASADNMRERGRLIDEAMRWHNLALDLEGDGWDLSNDDLEDEAADSLRNAGRG